MYIHAEWSNCESTWTPFSDAARDGNGSSFPSQCYCHTSRSRGTGSGNA
jgi:hypothetical protein